MVNQFNRLSRVLPPRLLPGPTLCTGVSALLVLLLASGCNVTKYLPADEYLYNGAEVEVTAPEGVATAELTTAVTSVLNQNTNSKIPLIGYRPIYRWYKFEEKLAEKPEKFGDKEHWGEEPIFYDENVVESVNTLLQNRASNEGYFVNESEWELDTTQNPPTISANYALRVSSPYLIDSIRQFWSDTSIARRIGEMQPETRLSKGNRYELDNVKAERQRWENELRRQGYYYVQADDFIFLADTVAGNHEVDLLAKLKDEVPSNHLQPQRITRINVFANTGDRDSTERYETRDSIQIGGLNLICRDCPLRPEIIDEAFQQQAGDLYNPVTHQTTLRRLSKYNTFRYIAMDYQPVPGSDSTLILNAYMEPRLRRRFEGELGLSYNSADYFGPNVRLAYVNRNLLRGAELLRIEGEYTLAQFLGDAGTARVPRSSLFGLTASLEIPRLWLPYKRKLLPRVTTSGTVIELGAKVESLLINLKGFGQEIRVGDFEDLSSKLESDPDATERLSLAEYRFSYGYTWSRRVTKSHKLNPVSIRFQDPIVSSPEVLDLAQTLNFAGGMANDATTTRFDRMFVISPNYTYTLDSRLRGSSTHSFFLNQFVSMNQNNVTPIGRGADMREPEVSYYPLLNTDFRYYFTLNQKNQIAVRLHGGIAFPLFSDRVIVPFFDLFSIGGPNSLRGFRPRGLGPGNTVPENNTALSLGGFGNLLLETSLEYRYRVNSLLELALFTDAGNIWTYKSEVIALETDFQTDAFSGQIAVDAGIGFRFDLQFLIFRIDLAKPVVLPYDPNAPEIQIPNIGARDAPNDGVRLVVAFGYPF